MSMQARLALPVLLVTAAVSPPLLLAPAEAQQAKDFASRPRSTPAWQARICPFSPDIDGVSAPVTKPMLACALRQGKPAAVLLGALSELNLCVYTLNSEMPRAWLRRRRWWRRCSGRA